MAIVKMNVVGTKKAMLVYALSGCKCLQCRTKLGFKDFQLDHITAQQTYIESGLAVNHKISNLATLCKACNSEKSTQGFEFYSDDAKSFLAKIAKWEARATNQNDIRTMLKNPVRNVDGKVITKEVMTKVCDNYAMQNPTSKFARIHRNGIFAQSEIA